MRAARTLAIGNAVLGAAVALRPGAVASAVGSAGGRPHPGVVRVLGARQFLQGLVTAAVPTTDVLWLGATVDATHAATMAPLLPTRFRRAASISAAVAMTSAVCSVLLARTSRAD